MRRPRQLVLPDAGGASPQTVGAPLPVPVPALPGGTPQNPLNPLPNPSQLPDFSGAIRSLADEWGGMMQVVLGLFIVAAGAGLVVLSTRAGRSGARLAAQANPYTRAASMVL